MAPTIDRMIPSVLLIVPISVRENSGPLIKKVVGNECRAVDYISATQWLAALENMSTNGADNSVVLLPVKTVDAIGEIISDNATRSQLVR